MSFNSALKQSVVCLPLLIACTSPAHRGVVAMKLNGSEAHVGMGAKDVSVGDHVELYRHACTGGAKAIERSCKRQEVGHGEVVQVLNDDYSLIRFDPGVTFSEGDTVEKHSH